MVRNGDLLICLSNRVIHNRKFGCISSNKSIDWVTELSRGHQSSEWLTTTKNRFLINHNGDIIHLDSRWKPGGMNHESGFLEFPSSASSLFPSFALWQMNFPVETTLLGLMMFHIVSYKQPAKYTKSYVYSWKTGMFQYHWTHQEQMRQF